MRSDLFLVVCKCFSILTSSTAVLCIAVNVFDGIFRCYEVLIAAFVVLAETEWEFIIKFWKSTFLAPLGTDPVVVDLMGLGKGEAWINVRALEGIGQILKPMKMVALIFVIIMEHTIVISA
ncbi:hypothetical protein FEM48_Zijuj01G0209000 [Ziziphus jujuba var. spinosa]|uniref:Uncharacterized protein n=1 Tax=Ziziphus jujuba var. spinosa TaxID=714518 RepID=A0A978W3I1_ZIZJJ|nr:hypothetical protein FEM48_Zijuj01G0209000 [Ziziphus jujuba var. spinosa]